MLKTRPQLDFNSQPVVNLQRLNLGLIFIDKMNASIAINFWTGNIVEFLNKLWPVVWVFGDAFLVKLNHVINSARTSEHSTTAAQVLHLRQLHMFVAF